MNARQKGRAFVLKCIDRLKPLDEATYEVAGSGAGRDKGDIRVPRFDLVIEAKDQNKVSMADWTLQADRQNLGYSKSALLWRHPQSPSSNPDIRVDIDLDYFVELLERAGEPKIKKEDRQMQWKLQALINAAKALLKEIE